eukprot:scaffold33855_cov67-Phaeocystis_antarctica.AAC.6
MVIATCRGCGGCGGCGDCETCGGRGERGGAEGAESAEGAAGAAGTENTIGAECGLGADLAADARHPRPHALVQGHDALVGDELLQAMDRGGVLGRVEALHAALDHVEPLEDDDGETAGECARAGRAERRLAVVSWDVHVHAEARGLRA